MDGEMMYNLDLKETNLVWWIGNEGEGVSILVKENAILWLLFR